MVLYPNVLFSVHPMVLHASCVLWCGVFHLYSFIMGIKVQPYPLYKYYSVVLTPAAAIGQVIIRERIEHRMITQAHGILPTSLI